jgi:thiol-disulfide isomerase/thioredoxin
MKNNLFFYSLLIFTVIFMAGCATSIPQLPINNNLQGNESDQGNNQDESTGVPRVVFIELFNADGCAASKAINPIIEEIVAEYENTEVILVEMAGWGKHATEETYERFKWYFPDKSELHTPSVCFNGLNQLFAQGFSLGGGGNSGNSGNEDVGDAGDNEDPGTVEVDTTKPVITGSRAPLPNSFGWNNTDVTVSFSCEDVGTVQSGIVTNTVAGATVTKEGKNQSVTNTGVLIDAAGNVADPVTVSNINIDKTPPAVTITLPGTGEYVLNQSITATWSATDTLSGVVSPASGTVSINTSSVGTKTFTLLVGTAKDKAGNSSLEVTKSYSVIADTEEPVIVDLEDPEMVYPQKWATGTGTAINPWANGCVESAVAACPSGGTVYLRAGYYQLAGLINVTTPMNIIGEGIGNTFIVTANDLGFYINTTDYVTLQGFTIDGDAQDNTVWCIYIRSACSYITLRDIEVKNSGKYGIASDKNNYSLFENIYIHDSGDNGLHPGTDTAPGWNMHNIYRNIYVYDNGVAGIDDIGNQDFPDEELYNIYDNINAWDNVCDGISISNQRNLTISNSSAYGNGFDGIFLYKVDNSDVHDCSVILNHHNGIDAEESNNINITNIISKNNNTIGAGGAGYYYGGIEIDDSNNIKLTSCQSYDDRYTPLQAWGITIGGTNTGISLMYCILTPNKLGDIYNPNGLAIDIITEKMLAKF